MADPRFPKGGANTIIGPRRGVQNFILKTGFPLRLENLEKWEGIFQSEKCVLFAKIDQVCSLKDKAFKKILKKWEKYWKSQGIMSVRKSRNHSRSAIAYGFEHERWTKTRIHYWLPIGFVTVHHSLGKEVTYQQQWSLFLVKVSLVYISAWNPILRIEVASLHWSVGGWSGVYSIHCCLHRISFLFGLHFSRQTMYLKLEIHGWLVS